MGKQYVMAVTNDMYELPMSPPMTKADLARVLGCTISNICHRLRDNKVHTGPRKYILLDASLIDEVEDD